MYSVGTLLSSLPSRHGRRFNLGIDGLSRSGKTTFTREVSQALQASGVNVVMFHLDDHIVERARRYGTGHPEWYEHYGIQWDVGQLQRTLFSTLRNASEICLPFYQEETDEQTVETVYLPNDGIIIVEGVFLQRPEWRPSFDFVVYLDCPRDIRFARESEATQKNLQKFQNRQWPAEDHYLDMVWPVERADLVLRDDDIGSSVLVRRNINGPEQLI